MTICELEYEHNGHQTPAGYCLGFPKAEGSSERTPIHYPRVQIQERNGEIVVSHYFCGNPNNHEPHLQVEGDAKVRCEGVYREAADEHVEIYSPDLDETNGDAEVAFDPVRIPSHYNQGSIEVANFIADQNLPYNEGNVVKYVVRAGKKDQEKTLQDLEKAAAYLQMVYNRAQGLPAVVRDPVTHEVVWTLFKN